jgi:two-component system chemotaxis sensor kinase CheA
MRRAADAAGHIRQRAAGLMEGMVAGDPDSGVEGLGQEIQALIGAWERDVTTSIERAERQLQSAHGKAEAMRLLPIAVLFGTLERTVRDAALTTGKRATFVADGGDVRLDAQVIAVVKRALVQIVRNAVAHGIETVEERTAAQKSPTGSVDLQIRRSGARIVFRCSDDGRGIDRDSVCRAAVALGRLDPSQDPATVELLPLLLDGGLSTSGAVTPVAGRGVGLDVVRTVAAEVGGEISLQTEPGRGTVLELVVPALLTSQQALISLLMG